MGDDAKTTISAEWVRRMAEHEAADGGEIGAGLLATDPAWPKRRPGCQTGCGVLIGCFRADCPARAEVKP